MNNQNQLLQIRKKKLSILIFDARNAARRTPAECAEALGIPVEEYLAMENAQRSPTLPQLELLSLFLNVPIDHFWGKKSISQGGFDQSITEKNRTLALRNRIIGVTIRLTRTNKGLSPVDLAQKTGLSEDLLNQYELGTTPIPLLDLEAISSALELPLQDFYDQQGPIHKMRAQQDLIQAFTNLPADLQQFISKPTNLPYLHLAMHLSDLSAERLRSIAESILEITY
jgi:transcriptional regulator with XRE-family HTH domain